MLRRASHHTGSSPACPPARAASMHGRHMLQVERPPHACMLALQHDTPGTSGAADTLMVSLGLTGSSSEAEASPLHGHPRRWGFRTQHRACTANSGAMFVLKPHPYCAIRSIAASTRAWLLANPWAVTKGAQGSAKSACAEQPCKQRQRQFRPVTHAKSTPSHTPRTWLPPVRHGLAFT